MEKGNHTFSEEDHHGEQEPRDDGSGNFSGDLDFGQVLGIGTPFGVVTGVEVRTIPGEHVAGAGVGSEVHWQRDDVDLSGQPDPQQ